MSLPRFRGNPAEQASPLRLVKKTDASAGVLIGLFVLMCFGVMHVARVFFVPLVLALLFALILLPAVRRLRIWHIPPAVGAMVVLITFAGGLSIAGFVLAGPIRTWAQRAPEVVEQVSRKFEPITRKLRRFRAEVEKSAPVAGPSSVPLRVEVKQSNMLRDVMNRTGGFLSLAATTFILLYFLLATGDALFSSCLAEVTAPEARRHLAEIGQDIQHHVSSYLLAIAGINVAEGVLIGGGLAFDGMPTPLLWGAMHAILNFIPYFGSITGLLITTAISLISFPSVPRALVAPAIYVAVMALDNFATPMLLGKRLVLNPALVFVSLMLWGWMWGLVGVLVAVPILVVFKIVCDHTPPLQSFGRILSSASSSPIPPHQVAGGGRDIRLGNEKVCG